MNSLPNEDSSTDFDDELPSIDGAIIDNSGEFAIKPLEKTKAVEQPKASDQPPKAAESAKQEIETRPIEPLVEPEHRAFDSTKNRIVPTKANPVCSPKVENLLDDIISQGQTKPRQEFTLDQSDIEQAMEKLDSLEVEHAEFIREQPSIEEPSTPSTNAAFSEEQEERVDSLEIESMLSELESFENRQSGKITGSSKPQQPGATEPTAAVEPQRARSTSSFTETDVQKMLHELATIEAREEEAEEKKAAQSQTPARRITRENKPVAPAPQKESGNHKIIQNPNKTAPPAYSAKASYGAVPVDQKRDRRNRLIAASVLFFCGLAIVAGLIYQRKNTSLRIEQSLTASGGQQIAKMNYDLLDLVRKAPSKSGGSTIDQDITNTLNRKHGRNWQPVGWKSDQSGENASSTVKFLWSEGGINKEAVWQIDSSTRKIKAANEAASVFTP